MPGVSPRTVPLEELVKILLGEHEEIRKGLWSQRVLFDSGEFAEISHLVSELQSRLAQHMLDEESRVLKFLIQMLSRESSSDAIEVFQQHRKIMALLHDVQMWEKLSFQEYTENFEELASLLIEHMEKEEKTIFPMVMRMISEQGRKDVVPAFAKN